MSYDFNPSNDNIDPQFELWKPGDEYGGLIETTEEDAFGQDFPDKLLVPRSDWRDAIEQRKSRGYTLRNHFPYIFDQSPESSCVLNAATRAAIIRWCVSLGNKLLVVPSPMSVYGRVAAHRHSGYYMARACDDLVLKGFLPSNRHGQSGVFKHTMHENTPFTRNIPSGWEETAKDFRVAEDGWFRIRSKEQFASALLNDMPICYGRRGHSICAEDLIWHNNQFMVSSCDSYAYKGNRDKGRIYDSERNWSTSGAWCCHSVRLPSEEMLTRIKSAVQAGTMRLEGPHAGQAA